MNERPSIPTCLQETRDALDMGKSELARTLGVSPTSIHNWESGNSSPDAYRKAAIRRLWEGAMDHPEDTRRTVSGLGPRSVSELLGKLFTGYGS